MKCAECGSFYYDRPDGCPACDYRRHAPHASGSQAVQDTTTPMMIEPLFQGGVDSNACEAE